MTIICRHNGNNGLVLFAVASKGRFSNHVFMHQAARSHSWDLTPQEAVRIQEELRAAVVACRLTTPVRWVAGVDAAFSEDGRTCLAAATLWDAQRRVEVETVFGEAAAALPYIPGLLSFREAPAILVALARLSREPDVIVCDGHGVAHPRRFGIACHVGLLTQRPTFGCAKSRLVGAHRMPGKERGCRTALRIGTERVGTVLRTRRDVKPVYVSVGHLIDLAACETLTLQCGAGFRLPEPTRLADRQVAAYKRRRST